MLSTALILMVTGLSGPVLVAGAAEAPQESEAAKSATALAEGPSSARENAPAALVETFVKARRTLLAAALKDHSAALKIKLRGGKRTGYISMAFASDSPGQFIAALEKIAAELPAVRFDSLKFSATKKGSLARSTTRAVSLSGTILLDRSAVDDKLAKLVGALQKSATGSGLSLTQLRVTRKGDEWKVQLDASGKGEAEVEGAWRVFSDAVGSVFRSTLLESLDLRAQGGGALRFNGVLTAR